MYAHATRTLVATILAGLAGMTGCEESETPAQPQSRQPTAETAAPDRDGAAREPSSDPDDLPPTPTPDDEANAGGTRIDMQGVTLVVPEGWVPQPVEPGPMSPEHVFTLPQAGEDSEPGEVRITYFPNMKGMDDANIQRWIGQVKRPDGSSYRRDDVEVSATETGHVRLTVVDLTGIVQATMRAEPKPDHRMIAAIVDHPQGPHFVVAAGPVKTIGKWEEEIDAFLKSAAVK